MALIELIFSRLGPYLGLTLARILPQTAAYKVGDWIVWVLLRQTDSALYQSVRANQAVVRGWSFEDERLHAVVREVLTNSAYGLVDWFRAISKPSIQGKLPCRIDQQLIDLAVDGQEQGYGAVIVGGHLSSFNIFLMKIAENRWPVQILTHREEEGSYQSDNIFRRKFGLNVTPISTSSLRAAYQRLKSGGFVLTAVDRPDTGTEELTFFGRPATMPTGHARLALKTGSYVMVLAVQKVHQGFYQVVGTRLAKEEVSGDLATDVRALAQRVLYQLEEYIRERPSEWLMFKPVWPEVIPE